MNNKTFIIETVGYTEESAFVVVAENSIDAYESFLQFRKDNYETDIRYQLFEWYRQQFEVTGVYEVPTKKSELIY
ncbi:hypothetical protein CN918_30355 [Priestia megaterium]|nr:hypothetical protein CN918_30355 [Priestia megaterium]